MSVVFTGVIKSLNSRVDNSWTVRIESQELPGDILAQINDFKQKSDFCKVYLSNDKITDAVKKTVDGAEMFNTSRKNSKAQQFRAALWQRWNQGGKLETFENYYDYRLNQLIEMELRHID